MVKEKKDTKVAEASSPAAPATSVERKITKDELIPLQKEGRLTSYNPTTGMGTVKAKGSQINFPGGDPKVV